MRKTTMHKYITTTLPYVNDDPHVGHALEFVQADALARYWRLMGHDVHFNTGTDEHGQKILRAATAVGEDPKTYVDRFADRFKKLNKEVFGLSFDTFVRTTDEAHIIAAQEMWRRCEASGDIYKKTYRGLYCVGCEAFKTESDLVDGKCVDHKREPEEIEEENYFFKLSKYQSYLEEYLSQEGVIVPEWRRQEALAFVRRGLEDFSISREAQRMSWGIPVSGGESQVMYVWFDALTNYISALGWPHDTERFERFWEEGETLQVAGKDQIRFQSIMWQAMLKSAGIRGTDRVFYHGFITSDGHKMSKSIGNVISPFDIVERYGTDATRYMLLRHVHPVDDSDITWEKMDEWYTAHLVNGLGNLASRIMKMAETHLEKPIEKLEAGALPKEYTEALDCYAFNEALDYVWKRFNDLDEKITDTEPFKLVKVDREAGVALIAELVQELYLVTRLLNPIMPNTSAVLTETILANKKPDNLFPRL